MMVWKRIFLFKWVIFRFHVNLPGCKPTHLSKLSSSLSSSHPAQPRERSQEALAKGDDLEQALQCRKELRFIGRCLWQKMLIFWFSCSEKSYSQILTWHFWHFGLVRETIYINQFYPDLIRCGFSMSGDFRSASQSDYCTSILSFSMFCSTLFNKKHAVFFEEILHHLQDFFHQQCVFFNSVYFSLYNFTRTNTQSLESHHQRVSCWPNDQRHLFATCGERAAAACRGSVLIGTYSWSVMVGFFGVKALIQIWRIRKVIVILAMKPPLPSKINGTAFLANFVSEMM